MALAQHQARYRARDDKKLVQIRLTPEALARLDRLVEKRGASGRAEILESLITGRYADPIHGASDALRLLREFFQRTGERSVSTPDGSVVATRKP